MKIKTALYIMSCDKNIDILQHSLISIEKYFNDFNLKCFIGANSVDINFDNSRYEKIIANKSNWKEESIVQLQKIKYSHPEITHLIVILDDFIINKKVDKVLLSTILEDPILNKFKYLRLKVIEESIIKKLFNFFEKKSNIGKTTIFKIRKTHPYYFSLQIAIWDINYLINSIQNAQNIWHFENQFPRTSQHWSVTKNIFNYRHVVEKGRWEYYAKQFCLNYIEYFKPGNREIIKNSFLNNFIFFLKRLKFLLIGYIKLK